MTVPRVGVTAGDPGGIGPEVAVKTLSRPYGLPPASYVLFAPASVVEAEERRLGVRLGVRPWDPGRAPEPGVFLADLPGPVRPPETGRVAAANGEISFRAFEAAVAGAREGRLDAVVTAPISKAAWAAAGLPFLGHTDYLARFYPGAVMTFWSDRLKVALLSHHRPLLDAVAAVRKDALLGLFRTLHAALDRLPGRPYRLLAAGLNPHAGEEG